MLATMKTHLCVTTLLCCAVTLLSFAVTSDSSAQDLFFLQPQPYIVAQSDYAGENGNPGGAVRGYPFAQTFTPTRSGTLFSISGGFFAPQTGLEPYYIFQFRDTTPTGLPASQVAASVNVPTDILSIPPPLPGGYGWIDLTADFSSFGITLSAGHKYAFSIDVPGPFGTTIFNSFFWGETGSGYAGGQPYAFIPSGLILWDANEDFLFTVKAVPEPSLMPLAVLLCAWVLRAHRRQGIPSNVRG